MNKIIILVLVTSILLLAGCKDTDENRQYFYKGFKAEEDMQYDIAISHYAKALSFDMQDAVSWYSKGRCHLLLAMTEYFMNEDTELRNGRIKGNLSKAQDCFRRAQQWGYRNSAEVDTLNIKLQETLIK